MDKIADLGDGLVLRRATPADSGALAAFNATNLRDAGETEPNAWVASWTRDLLRGTHPTFAPGDFTVVEEARTGKIVSSLNLISQTWAYDGIPFGVGRVELVSTDPEYRRRGLVRRQIEVVHRWSSERGELVQGITGIPFYYRQFGYEMALELDGRRTGYRPQIPDLDEGASEPFRIRPATTDDLPLIASLDAQGRRRSLVAAVRDEALWRYELEGRSEEKYQTALRIIEGTDDEALGYLAHWGELAGSTLWVVAYELAPGTSWLAVTPSVLRYLRATGEAYHARDGKRPFEGFTFTLGTEHPVYRAIPDRLPRVHQPYAWYLRVPDLPAFLRHVAPALDERLANSVAAGHAGELRLNFYRSGLQLTFAGGRLQVVETWADPDPEEAGASFPGLTFLQLLFGYRSLAELDHAFADCYARTEEARVLLDSLFPRQPSLVWPIQ